MCSYKIKKECVCACSREKDRECEMEERVYVSSIT